MKIMIVTTPIRPLPTNYPPVGSLSLINYLRKHDYDDVEFYNIDANRPSYEEAVEHIVSAEVDVLGVSAVVSTAYEYTKRLTTDVKTKCPNTLIVVGGNLAASAEILLKRTGTDLCALGEGEKVLLNVAQRAEHTRAPHEFGEIPGLVFLDADGQLINTGYQSQLQASEVYDIDWNDLECSSDIGIFIAPAFDEDGVPPAPFH